MRSIILITLIIFSCLGYIVPLKAECEHRVLHLKPIAHTSEISRMGFIEDAGIFNPSIQIYPSFAGFLPISGIQCLEFVGGYGGPTFHYAEKRHLTWINASFRASVSQNDIRQWRDERKLRNSDIRMQHHILSWRLPRIGYSDNGLNFSIVRNRDDKTLRVQFHPHISTQLTLSRPGLSYR